MDLAKLAAVLGHTLSNEDAPRKSAEAQLSALESVEGFCPSLLRLITVPEVAMPVKHSAILRLKNVVQEYWPIVEGKDAKIKEADRKIVKDNLVESYIFQPAQVIRVQLLECLYTIIREDFPTQWP